MVSVGTNHKQAMIENSKLERLVELLDEAEKLAGQYTGGYSDHFFSAEEFHTALAASIQKLKAGDNDQLNTLWLWFAPSYDWDDFISKAGQDLANKIFGLLIELRKQH
jgi:hypothetical protein